MARYSAERKASVLKKLLPPHNKPVAEVAEQEGIGKGTLYNWLSQAKEEGVAVPGSGKTSEQWSAESKLAVVVETASKSESALSEYCRSKGLYPEQVKAWRQACLEGQSAQGVRQQREQVQAKKDKKEIKALKQELARKEKALAEAAALLILRKKFNALWEEKEES